MMIVSLDHSPQEHELAEHELHTLALVASSSAKQWGWSHELGRAAGSQSGALRKWSARNNKKYRAAFAESFPKLLAQSDALVMARTASAAHIRRRAQGVVADYGLAQFLDLCEVTTVFGPTSSGATYALRTRVAASVLSTFDFIVRMHRALHDHWSETADWQISPDTPPDGAESQAALVFSALLNSAQGLGLVHGRLSALTHLQGDEGTDLADNVAGMLREAARNGDALETSPRPIRGAIYWER